jgi:hypothetical protein
MESGVKYILRKLVDFVNEEISKQSYFTVEMASLRTVQQPVSFMNIVLENNSIMYKDFSLSAFFRLIKGNRERHFETYAWVNNLYCLESKSPIIFQEARFRR